MALPDPGHIFFYGTLMSGFGLRRRAAIEPFVRFVGPGAVRAALFDLGPYPAAIRAEGTVRGELYAVTCADRLIPRVDAIEGCVPGDVLQSQYVREAVEVRLDRGLRQCAWMYFYALSLGAGARARGRSIGRTCSDAPNPEQGIQLFAKSVQSIQGGRK